MFSLLFIRFAVLAAPASVSMTNSFSANLFFALCAENSVWGQQKINKFSIFLDESCISMSSKTFKENRKTDEKTLKAVSEDRKDFSTEITTNFIGSKFQPSNACATLSPGLKNWNVEVLFLEMHFLSISRLFSLEGKLATKHFLTDFKHKTSEKKSLLLVAF